jgi:hypothetical protein
MSTTTTTNRAAAPARTSLASSTRFMAFAVTFAIGSTLMYLACEWFNLPLITYHPATNRIALWWEAARSGEGPAMYWYGWTLTSLIVGAVLGTIATFVPPNVIRRIPLFLVWLLPLLIFIPLTYSLMPFWTK